MVNPLSLFVGPFNTFIVFPLINALVALYELLFSDFGLAIVVLTVAIRLVLYPLFVTQLRSQRAMQELQPAIAELRRKYKGDQRKFAEEQMKLYRERGYNPATGCLPLLLQFPLLIGLYSALQQVGCGLGQPSSPPPDYQGSLPYCPGLSHGDLQQILWPIVPNPVPAGASGIDTTAHWLPWISPGLTHADPWHVLPVLAGLTQLVASLMTLPPKAPPTDDPMQKSMQSMVYYFPLFTVFIAWSLPAGLGLYWVVTTLFSIVQQYFVSGVGKLGVYLPALNNLPAPRRPFLPVNDPPRDDPPKIETAVQSERQRRRRRRR